MTARREPAASLDARMVLVVGARRSGTNWVGRILTAHPDVHGLPNETYLFQGLAQLRERFHHGSKGSWQLAGLYVDRDDLLGALRRFCTDVLAPHLEGAGSASRLLERSPDHVRHLGLVHELLPEAHVVHIVRDGRDVARSLVSMSWGPDDLADAAREWATAVAAARNHPQRADRFHEVRYEDLLADPRRGIEALFRVLDLAVDVEILDRAVAEAGVPYNHDPSSPALAPGKWKEALSPAAVEVIEDVAGHELAAAGYELGPPAAGGRWRLRRIAAQPSRITAALRRRVRAVTRTPRHPLNEAQRVVDRFLEAARGGQVSEVRSLLHEHARVRVVRGTQRWEGRGPAGAEPLVEAIRAAATFTDPVAAHDVHPSAGVFTIVASVPGGDSSALMTTLVLATDGRQVTQVAWYAASG